MDFSKKSKKQMARMLATRAKNISELSAYTHKYSEYLYSGMPRYTTAVKNADKKISALYAWIDGAVEFYGEDAWDEIVHEADVLVDLYSYEARTA